MDGKLKCHHCENEFTAEQILAGCQYSYPQMEALGFICPTCNKASQIRIKGGTFQSIEVISAPGPEWVIHDSLRPNGFEYRIDPEWVHCWLGGRHYEFKST